MKSLKRKWLLFFLPAAILLTVLSSASSSFSEWYATTLYRWLSLGINTITSLFPLSLAEFLVPLAILSFLAYLILAIIRCIRFPEFRKRQIQKLFLNISIVISILFFSFTVCCGINYSRLTFADVCGLEVRDSSQEELVALCTELADTVNLLREQVAEDENGIMILSQDLSQTASYARDAFNLLEKDYPTLTGGYGIPKQVLCSRLMSECNITGIFFPFTFEANVNTDAPDYSIPATMCHELTHLRGYMREDEANFIAYLASRESNSADLQYSGAMLAFVYANNALYAANPELGSATYQLLCEGAQRDFAYNNAYWDQFKGPVSEIATQVNDTYLKANRQEDGVKSYGRMVDLLLADYRKQNS